MKKEVKVLGIYDNNGKTCDRYTVCLSRTDSGYTHIGMDSNPWNLLSPLHYRYSSTRIDKPSYKHLGKRIKFEDLPEECQKMITYEINCKNEKVDKMKKTIDFIQFRRAFNKMSLNCFSYEGLEALFNYLTNLENELGNEFELDPVLFSCTYTEYEDLEEFQENYSDKYTTIEQIMDEITFIKVNGKGFIIQNF